MGFRKIVEKNRSFRRFHEDAAIDIDTLKGFVDLARLSASGANAQPLKYVLANDEPTNSKIFAHLSWAGYLEHWHGPPKGERPAAYVIVLLDTTVRKDAGVDHGIAAQTIMLAACEQGLGGCILGSIKRKALGEALHIPTHFEILLVLALGKPKETVQVEPVGLDGNIRYWRDEEDVHHVPKRSLDEILVSLEAD